MLFYYLSHIIIKGDDMNKNETERLLIGKRCSAAGICANLFLFLIKLTASIISGSLSQITDAFNNLTDASASIVSLIGFRFSGKKADDDHPYGHARAEYLSALIVAMIILVIGFEFIKTSVKEIINPTPVTLSPIVFAILILSVIIKIFMAMLNYHAGVRIKSKTLIATYQDSRNDALITTAVILGYVISLYTALPLDGYISLFVALFIFVSGIGLIKSTMDPLLGQAPDKELVSYIHTKILSYPGILGTHDLIVHDYGVGKRFASVHVEMAAEEDVMESHDIIDRMEHDFLENDSINMIVHFDPIITKDGNMASLRRTVTQIAAKIHPDCTIHDLRLNDNVIYFDCVKPESCTISDEALIAAFDVALRLANPDYSVKITIDTSFSPIIH